MYLAGLITLMFSHAFPLYWCLEDFQSSNRHISWFDVSKPAHATYASLSHIMSASTLQITTTCCPTTRQSSVRNHLACAVKDMPVHITITAKTEGAARTSTNTGALWQDSCVQRRDFKIMVLLLSCDCVKESNPLFLPQSFAMSSR